MPTFLEGLGQNMAGNAANGIMGVILGEYNDQRQLNQQELLQNLQIRGQKEMTDYQMMKQLEMWKATNYPAQLEMMKKAGLSPGLMYGKGGAGGTTVGSASGNVAGATAPTGGGEIAQIMQIGMQKQMTDAQIEVMKSQAELNRAEAANKPIQGENIQTQTMDLLQGIQNKRAQEILTGVQTQVAGLDAQLKGLTLKDMADKIAWEAGKALYDMEMAERSAYIQKATMNDKIDTVKAEMLGAFLRNALTAQQTAESKSRIQVNDADLTRMAREGVQKWRQIEIQAQQANTGQRAQEQDAWVNDVQKSTGIPMEILREAVDGILRGGRR